MHMADALLSPAVGATFWAGTVGTIGYASRKLKRHLDDRKIPLMGVLGAFIFAAQMINFTIPGTGSSGHIGGGMILAVLLGPHAAGIHPAPGSGEPGQVGERRVARGERGGGRSGA